jgi:hypothetical protein
VARRRAFAIAVAVVVVVVVVILLAGGSGGHPFAPFSGGAGDPLAYSAGRQALDERRAAAGLAPVLYEKSPGGVVATARRVAHWRPLVERVARAQRLDPDMLEALIFLESGGRADAQASSDLNGAAGLTQILAQTGSGLLGLHVDVAASTRLTQRIARGQKVAASVRQRRVVDQRFDPASAIAATGRYLALARKDLGRDDLAFESYHMGIGNLQGALRAYGETDIPYAQLFFDSTPLRHAAAWDRIARLGDDSSTYLWRLFAARDVMRRWRADPGALSRHAGAVLSPAPSAPGGPLVRVAARDLVADGVRVSAQRTLMPAASAALLRYVGLGVRRIANVAPLVAGPSHRLALDVLRSYRSPAQAQAFQFALDRLTALDVISWSRTPAVIHILVSNAAARELAPAP